jgi:sporulation protein YlmC with PRC-barrel domain
MPEILASALREKPVLSTGGRELGTVYNLTMERRTGKLDTLLVDPNGGGFEEFETTADGYLRIPAAMIDGIDDQLMITLENE